MTRRRFAKLTCRLGRRGVLWLLAAVLALTSLGAGAPAAFAAKVDCTKPANAVLDDCKMDLQDWYSQQDPPIAFYSANAGCTGPTTTQPATAPVSGQSTLRQAVDTYGQTAMDMQTEYGTPWELVFAQMQMETSTGTAGPPIHGATNNWLNITGTGDTDQSIALGNHTWAIFTSVDAAIQTWAGPKVARNGAYDAAFAHLDPASYDLNGFIAAFIPVYAPSSDGNDVASYIATVESLINGPIQDEAKTQGWPTSADYAKQNNIPIGGQHPLDAGKPPSATGTPATSSPACDSGAGNGSLNDTAITLSWPDRSHMPTDAKPEYKAALAATGVNKLGDSCSMGGYSCDAFVATVMRYSGVDKDFPCCGTSTLAKYLDTSGKYTEIPNTGSTDNLQPGDIMIVQSKYFNGVEKVGHIMMYVVLPDGSSKIASASHCNRTADHAGGVYYTQGGYSFHIYRWKGGT